MRTNPIKIFGCMLLLTLGAVACKGPKPKEVDPYAPVTEGKVFLPVLVNKPDMDKVLETEKKRGGELKEMLNPDPKEGREQILYRFEYKEMDIKEVEYYIHPETKILESIIMKLPTKQFVLAKLLLLSSKEGFDDKHVLAARYGGLARDRETLFVFSCWDEDGMVYVGFEQYGKQPMPLATIAELPDKQYGTLLGSEDSTPEKIKASEEKEGSTLMEESEIDSGAHKGKVYFALYALKAEKKPMTHRGYYFDWGDTTPADKLGLCREVVFFYSDASLGYYIDDIHKEGVPTWEFYAVCKKAGYEWVNGDINRDVFINKKEKMLLITRVFELEGSSEPLLGIDIHQASDSDLKRVKHKKDFKHLVRRK